MAPYQTPEYHPAFEEYCETIYELHEDDVDVIQARIAERLGQSGPTVSQTVGRMERDGLVVVSEDRTLELTDAGRRKAVDVMRKHRLAERLLVFGSKTKPSSRSIRSSSSIPSAAAAISVRRGVANWSRIAFSSPRITS